MALQSTVNINLGAGVVGELANDSPYIAKPYTLVGGAQTNDVGKYFTVTSEGVAAPGGTGAVGGILINPKHYALRGTTGGGTLAASLVLPDNSIGELLYEGEIWIAVPGAAAIGDALKYNTTTGVIGTGAPGGGEAAVPNSKVIDYTPSGAGLALVRVNN